MAFTNAEGVATVAGTTIYTVPANTASVVIGFRVVNLDTLNAHTVNATIGSRNICPVEMPLPPGSGYELTEGAKFVAKAGQSFVVSSDAEGVVDVFVSVLEQQ